MVEVMNPEDENIQSEEQEIEIPIDEDVWYEDEEDEEEIFGDM
jgi:hypothetical protein